MAPWKKKSSTENDYMSLAEMAARWAASREYNLRKQAEIEIIEMVFLGEDIDLDSCDEIVEQLFAERMGWA